MKRPAKLRAGSTVHPPTPSNSILSRVPLPLLHVNDISLSAWDVGDQIPGLRIPLESDDANDDDDDVHIQFNSATTLTPIITTSSATTEGDILSALRLVSDSVAQQRQIAVKCILTHPAILAPSIMLFLTIAKLLYHTGSPSDVIVIISLFSLCSLLALLCIRYMIRGYSTLAARVGNWSWLSASSVNGISQRRDELLLAKCGEDIVAVLVLRIAKTVVTPNKNDATNTTTTNNNNNNIHNNNINNNNVAGVLILRPPRSSRRKSSARWTGIIRAWSVKQSHRHYGVGTRLLEEAVGYCQLRSLDGPVFADDHANATQVLPSMFHEKFLEHDQWARRLLEQVIWEQRGR
ncbi:hypothetical protein ACJ72_00053 [Emergomyces africanus]|uniref:N-acetyltransferase domain-containing protein n=1 Tax=Emergomyces africanus TaxID=1955775 RepID=A0A1B7P9A4_9EURO|nr:hypothetical protein ACJ72_00053 [Emergomyces africanus]